MNELVTLGKMIHESFSSRLPIGFMLDVVLYRVEGMLPKIET
jgi:hypothetical protein